MIKEDKIYKIKNKHYCIDEYVYTIKRFNETFMVLILDFKANKFYIEDNYPIELFEKGKFKEISKLEFFEQNKDKLEDNVQIDFPKLYKNITTFEVQKSLF